MTVKLWSVGDLVAHKFEKPLFLCEPLVPSKGIVLLHGPAESGKTQLVMTLIKSIAEGTAFLGQFPCRPSCVLMVEVDTPDMIMQSRLAKWPCDLAAQANVSFLLSDSNINVLALTKQTKLPADFVAAQALKPDLVIFDVLRNIHTLDENDSRTVALVYEACQQLFPVSALLFIHHDRKKDAMGVRHRDEEASGSAAWRNLANVSWHMERTYDRSRPFVHLATLSLSKLRVEHRPLPIRLEMNDDTLLVAPTDPSAAQQAEDWVLQQSSHPTKKDVVQWLLDEKLCSQSTAYRIVQGLSKGAKNRLKNV